MEAGSSVKSTLLSLMSSQQEEYLAVFCRHTTVLPDTVLLPACFLPMPPDYRCIPLQEEYCLCVCVCVLCVCVCVCVY